MKILALFVALSTVGWLAFTAGGSTKAPLSSSAHTVETAGKNTSGEHGPKWKDWSTAYNAAAKKDRIVLVDLYTDWCGWCKRMDKDTYTQASVIEMIDKHYEPVKLNPEQKKTYSYEGKSYTGQQLVQRLNSLGAGGFRGYPTTCFIIPQAKGEDVVMIVSGYLNADQFKDVLQQVVAQSDELSRKS